MISIFKDSLLYRFFAAIGRWFSGQWLGSQIIRAFVTTKDADEVARSSIFYRPGKALRGVLSSIYRGLRLDRVFGGSLLVHPFLWCFLAAVFAPVLPTMALLGVVLISGVTFLLNTAAERRKTLLCSPVNRYVILYAVIYVIATCTSVTFSGSLYVGLLTTVFILSVFLVENAVQTKRQLNILVTAMVAMGVLISLYGFYQYIFGAAGSSAWTDDEMFSISTSSTCW